MDICCDVCPIDINTNNGQPKVSRSLIVIHPLLNVDEDVALVSFVGTARGRLLAVSCN